MNTHSLILRPPPFSLCYFTKNLLGLPPLLHRRNPSPPASRSELPSLPSLLMDLSQRFVPSSIPNENPNFDPLEYFESFVPVKSESEGEDPYDLSLSIVPDSEDDCDCAMLRRKCAVLRRKQWLKDFTSKKEKIRVPSERGRERWMAPVIGRNQWLKEAEERWMAPVTTPKRLRGEEICEPIDPILLIQFPLLRDLVRNAQTIL